MRIEFNVRNESNVEITSTSDVQQHDRYDHIVQKHSKRRDHSYRPCLLQSKQL